MKEKIKLIAKELGMMTFASFYAGLGVYTLVNGILVTKDWYRQFRPQRLTINVNNENAKTEAKTNENDT